MFVWALGNSGFCKIWYLLFILYSYNRALFYVRICLKYMVATLMDGVRWCHEDFTCWNVILFYHVTIDLTMLTYFRIAVLACKCVQTLLNRNYTNIFWCPYCYPENIFFRTCGIHPLCFCQFHVLKLFMYILGNLILGFNMKLKQQIDIQILLYGWFYHTRWITLLWPSLSLWKLLRPHGPFLFLWCFLDHP